jgi:hypothetical protein
MIFINGSTHDSPETVFDRNYCYFGSAGLLPSISSNVIVGFV